MATDPKTAPAFCTECDANSLIYTGGEFAGRCVSCGSGRTIANGSRK